VSLNVVGISAHFHDSACCLLQDGRLVAAAQEERFSRIKHDPSLPRAAFRYCLDAAGLSITDVDCIAYYENPVKKLDRQLWMGLPQVPPASPQTLFRLDAMRPEREIRELLGFEGPVEYFDHHRSHAASGYYYSGFPEAALLTVDAVGEWATASYGAAEGARLDLVEEVAFPDSLGLLYSAITAYLGFEVNDAEYKVMGLAPYGEPRYVDAIRSLVSIENGGGFRLDLRYFDFLRSVRMFSPELTRLLGAPPRQPDAPLTPFTQDVARSLQVVLEEVLLAKAAYLRRRVPSANLCLAGGVALNCVAVERIVTSGLFERVFVQPAASDAGGALGAAALAHVRRTGERPDTRLAHVFLGPRFDADGIAALFRSSPARVADFRGSEADLLRATVDRLVSGKVVGWFQGRMEFGPRALGNRSILADPRDPSMRERINALVKKREAFRPFAPAVLATRAAQHFELNHPAPFMVETCRVRSPLHLPAVTHVDGSARVQTVDADTSPRFARLLAAFEARTGCPILLNTSFNLRGEPIVCTPVEALLCFIRSDLDCLVLEDLLLDRDGLPDSWLRWLRDAPAFGAGVRDDVYTLL
jgi:carbamoyltransferase